MNNRVDQDIANGRTADEMGCGTILRGRGETWDKARSAW